MVARLFGGVRTLRPDRATLLRGLELVAVMKEAGRGRAVRGEAGEAPRRLLSRGIPLLLLRAGLREALRGEEQGGRYVGLLMVGLT